MILKPKDIDWELPALTDANDLFKYMADFNVMPFYETDLNGVINNEIPNAIFLVDKLDLVTPIKGEREFKYDGFLYLGVPSDAGEDVDNAQFDNIIKDLISKTEIATLKSYFCGYQYNLNTIRPLYNSNKYTKSTNTTGIEISYSVWI